MPNWNYTNDPVAGGGVYQAPTMADFPERGNLNDLYIADDTGKSYRWDDDPAGYREVSGGGGGGLPIPNWSVNSANLWTEPFTYMSVHTVVESGWYFLSPQVAAGMDFTIAIRQPPSNQYFAVIQLHYEVAAVWTGWLNAGMEVRVSQGDAQHISLTKVGNY